MKIRSPIFAVLVCACGGADEGPQAIIAPDYSACLTTLYGPGSEVKAEVPWDTPCEAESCSLDDGAADTLRRIQDSLRGSIYRPLYAETLSSGAAQVAFVAEFDWYTSDTRLIVPAGLDEQALSFWVADNFCNTAPPVVSYSTVLNGLQRCDESVRHAVCSNGFGPNNGCTPNVGGPGEASGTDPACFYHTHAIVSANDGRLWDCNVNSCAIP